jgi:hypothetical protein
MRYLKIVIALAAMSLLAGCKIRSEVANKENAIHTEVANKENAVGHVEPGAVVVEKDAVLVEKEAVHVEPDAIHVEKDAFGHVEPGAVKVEPGAVSIQGTMQTGAVQLPMTVQTGAVQMPLTTNVNDGAVKFNLELKVAEGAIVIKGAEAGAIQTRIETPWWAYIIMTVMGIGWLVTKFRKQRISSKSLGQPHPSQEGSFWDVLF